MPYLSPLTLPSPPLFPLRGAVEREAEPVTHFRTSPNVRSRIGDFLDLRRRTRQRHIVLLFNRNVILMRMLLLFQLFAAAYFSAGAWAQDTWPRFRGPNADGVAPDNAGLPTTWTTTNNVKWVADVPGWGWSCPIVWGDRVFLTTVVSDVANVTPSKGLYLGQGVRDPAKGIHHWMVYCFDLNTGKELWKHEAHTGQPKVPRHPKSTYASETPTTDGERLYVLFGDLGLYCYDFNGKPLWSQNIEPKKTFFDYGAAASPVVHDGQVIVVYDNLEESWIAAFDAKTGDERWRTPRDETHSWATPFVWENDLRTEIVVPGKKRNRSYSLDGQAALGIRWSDVQPGDPVPLRGARLVLHRVGLRG